MLVDRHLNRSGWTHVWWHTAWCSCCLRIFIPFWNVRHGSYFRWLQFQLRCGLHGVCIAAVSHGVAHWMKRLSFCLIWLQSHHVHVSQEPWSAVVERWGRWSRKEVGSREDYTDSYKSKWKKWQPTCTFKSSWILLSITTLRIATWETNGPTIGSNSVGWSLFGYRDTSWRMTANIPSLIHIKKTVFDGKDIWWSLSHDIARILHESHSNDQVLMYG